MDIDEFVFRSLDGIASGIVKAQESFNKTKGFVGVGRVVHTPSVSHYEREVAFDISVVVSEDKSLSGGAGFKLYVAEAGTKASTETSSRTTHSLRFSIPLRIEDQLKPTEVGHAAQETRVSELIAESKPE